MIVQIQVIERVDHCPGSIANIPSSIKLSPLASTHYGQDFFFHKGGTIYPVVFQCVVNTNNKENPGGFGKCLAGHPG
jgi:hypothetical protein